MQDSSILRSAKSTIGAVSQSSIAVAVAAHPSGSRTSSQAALEAAVGNVNIGASVSNVIRDATSEILLPHASVAVKMYSVVVVPPQVPTTPLGKKVIVGSLHISVADPPPFVATHVFIAAVLSTPHSTKKSAGDAVITGSVISSRVIVRVSVTIFPHSSSPIKVIVTGTLQVIGIAL